MFLPYLLYVGVAALTIISTDAATNGNRRSACRQASPLQNFDMAGFLGHWHVYSSHRHDFEAGCDCFTSEAVAINDTSMRISNCCQMTRDTNVTQTCDVGVNFVRLTNPERREAHFMFTRTGATLESPVWIVDTDYGNYAVINGCDRVSDTEEHEIFWILSRNTIVSPMVAEKIEAVLKTHNFETNRIVHQRHGADICKSQRPHHSRHLSSH